MGHWRLERRDRIAVATFSAPPRNFMTFADMTELEGLSRRSQDEAITVRCSRAMWLVGSSPTATSGFAQAWPR
jgi:hypothetical protein